MLFLSKKLDSGGVTKVMLDLASGLQSYGWDVAIASGGVQDMKWFEEYEIKHFVVHFPHKQHKWFKKFTYSIKGFLDLNTVVKYFQPKIIHVHWRSNSFFAYLMSKLYRIPFVVSLHSESIPSNMIYRCLSFWGDRAIAISQETRKCLISDFKVPSNKIGIVYNGVDNEHFRPPTEVEKAEARIKFGLRQNDEVVSLIGRLSPAKGHHILIKALAKLRSEGRDIKAIFAGVCDSKKTTPNIIRGWASNLGVVDLVNLVGYRDAREVLWASDISVLPSLREGFPMVTVEAMFCGVVPVRTPAGGAFDQIEDGVNGFIVPFNDHETLALRLNQLFDDEALRKKMSAAALKTARQKFTKKKMVEETIKIYKTVIENHNRKHQKIKKQ